MTRWMMLGLLGLTSNQALAVDAPHNTAPSGDHGAADGHGHGAQDAHAAGEGHAAGGGHHDVNFTDDDDHDGVVNFLDPTNGEEPNPAYIVKSVGFHILNLTILIAVLVYFVRRPIVDTFRERALGIRTELTESARRRDEAHQRHQELLARLDRIEGEVRQMEQEAETDAQREEEKLVERAHREAVRIGEQAERNIRDEATRARIELRREAVELAVKLAEATLEKGVKKADQTALARAFLKSVKGVEDV
jgi:F-type H+-transporting ATPase subunit b